MEVLVGILLACALAATTLRTVVGNSAAFSTVGTVFCGVFVQAIPFLVLGVMVSGLIAVFVSPERLARWLPRRPAAAVLVAGVGGMALPGCECGSVPLARRLFGEGGATGAAALTFMLAGAGDQPGRPGVHRGGVSGLARHGVRAAGRVAADRRRHGLGVVTLGPSGMDHAHTAGIPGAGRIAIGGVHRGGPSRLLVSRIVFGPRCRRRGTAARGRAAVGVHASNR